MPAATRSTVTWKGLRAWEADRSLARASSAVSLMAPTSVMWGWKWGPPKSDRRAVMRLANLAATSSGGIAHTEYTAWLAIIEVQLNESGGN